jgi:hypothetical protein
MSVSYSRNLLIGYSERSPFDRCLIESDSAVKQTPLCLLNGTPFNIDTITNENFFTEKVGTIFYENVPQLTDSSNYNKPRIVNKYFGQRRDNSIFFFTKDKIKEINKHQLYEYLKSNHKLLFKIGDEPLIDDIRALKHKKLDLGYIRMITNFSMKEFESDKVDTFTLFILEKKLIKKY